MDTIEPMVVRSPLGWEPVTPRAGRPLARTVVVLSIILVALVASSWVSLPYYALAPGTARSVDTLIDPGQAEIFEAKGAILLTTISLYQVNPLQAAAGWLRPDVDIVSQKEILPPQVSDEEYQKYNFDVMDSSKQTALIVALRRLGHEVKEHGQGALVEQVLPQFPAQGRLRVGDVIKAVDGVSVTLVQEATAAIGQHRPGEVLTIDVSQPDGSEARQVQVPLAADPEQGGKPVLGVVLRTFKRGFDLPFDVDIKSSGIGGPSAGLAFTLGIIDALTPGELTGGHKVAVTGTIEIDGRVGDVGGVEQKASTVKAAGADVFLVPAGEYEVARQRAGKGIKVIKVTTLQEALDALGSVGGDLTALGTARPGLRG